MPRPPRQTTTRMSRNRHSSSVCRAGNQLLDVVTSLLRTGQTHLRSGPQIPTVLTQPTTARFYEKHYTVTGCPADVSQLVLSPSRAGVRRILCCADGAGVLLQPDPLVSVRRGFHWTRQLRFVPERSSTPL